MNGPMCRKGKSCGATCIDARERCNIELGPLVSPSVKKVATGLGAMFMRQVEAGKAERWPSVPSDMKREIAALGKSPTPPASEKTSNTREQLKKARDYLVARGESIPSMLKEKMKEQGVSIPETSQKNQARTSQKVREDLKKDLKEELGVKQDASLNTLRSRAMLAIDRLENGSFSKTISPTELEQKQLRIESLLDRASEIAGPLASGNTRWARMDAKDFDNEFKIYKRIRGDRDVDWSESARKGTKLGEGSFGTVLRVGDMAVKRGQIGGEEAEIIKRVGAAGIGPKLHKAEIATPTYEVGGAKIHPGRIAMSLVKGRELGDDAPDAKVGNKTAADTYWTALSKLHKMGIAHNDAHPYNLMVDDKGVGRWVDMGLARQSPKAALGEAIGAFSKGAVSDKQTGNWQTANWEVTGISRFNALRNIGSSKEVTSQMQKDYPTLGRILANRGRVYGQLRRMGFSQAEIRELAETEIRSPNAVYNTGPWAKLTDTQAQSLINMLYDGI